MLTLKENETIDLDTMEVREKTPDELGQSTEKKDEQQPESKKSEPVKKEKEPEEEEEEEEEEVVDEKKSDESSETKEEEEEESDDKETPKSKKEEEEAKEDEVSVNDFLSEKYAEHYGIKTEEDLDDTLAVMKELEEEVVELKSKLQEVEKGGTKPKFSSEQEEKAFEFLKNFDVTKLNEGMQTFGRLITMDLATADPKIILEEKFILENPELTRDEAMKKFNRDFKRKYTVAKEDFDTEEAFNEEDEMRKIDLKADVAGAKKFLDKKQTEFKAKPKESENKEAKESPVVQQSITTHVSEVDEYMKEFDSLIFSDDNQDEFVYKLSKEQKKKAHEALKGWIGNPNSYDAKGKLIGWTGVDEKAQEVSYLLFGPDMIEKAFKHGQSIGERKRVDEIAKKKPNRVSKGGNGELNDLSEEQQWERIAKDKKSGRRQLA